MGHRYHNMIQGTLAEEVNRLFREIFAGSSDAERALENMEIPPADIYETSRDLVVELEAPGIDPASVKITLSTGRLTVDGIKAEHVEPGRLNYLCMERSFGKFRRIIPISTTIDVKSVDAVYEKGIITIRLPKIIEKRADQTTVPLKTVQDAETDDEQ